MQQNFSEIIYLTGNEEILENMPVTPVREMFADRTIEFLGALSKELLADKRTREYADVTSYAFWIRKMSLLKEKKKYPNASQRIGRGVAFHIAPSNVPINFAVSFTSALLAGNTCIVRVSNKEFVQVDIVVEALKRLYKDRFADMEKYLCLIRYEHSEEITQLLSNLCDVRIIWGGNRTIEMIRRAMLPPRAIELSFADRHSLAIVDADEYLKGDSTQIAKDFYTDTYYTDQNACSSPRIVIWKGNQVEKAQKRFWEALLEEVKCQYEFQPILASDKLNSLCKFATNHMAKKQGEGNLIYRVQVPELYPDLMEYKAGGGYFFEYITNDLEDIVPLLNKSCQTISYYGIEAEEIKDVVYNNGVRGVDRIIPMGHTMDLTFIWDGYNMIETMSRIVYKV